MRANVARRGFTLIELLVVIAILVALMAMIALAAPRFAERQGPSRGAMQLQSWINLARQMAIRDQRPRGLRILPPTQVPVPNDANYSRELQYIEQPDDFRAAPIDGRSWVQIPATPLPANAPRAAALTAYRTISITEVSKNAATPSIPFLPTTAGVPAYSLSDPRRDPQAPVQPGDLLHITDKTIAPNGPRRIKDIYRSPTSTGVTTYILELDNSPFDVAASGPWPVYDTEQYVIYRQVRPMVGEPVLQLPRDVGIDFSRDPNAKGPRTYTWTRFYPLVGTGDGQWIDIVFHSNGSVLSFGGWPPTSNRICLWVRDVSQDWNTPAQLTQLPPGDNSLITIYTRTGMVAGHPIATTEPSTGLSLLTPSPQQPPPQGWTQPWPPTRPTWNPFYFTQDSKSSGQ